MKAVSPARPACRRVVGVVVAERSLPARRRSHWTVESQGRLQTSAQTALHSYRRVVHRDVVAVVHRRRRDRRGSLGVRDRHHCGVRAVPCCRIEAE